MPTIFDNIEKFLETGLNNTLDRARRADFCIGYFNLRGWSKLYKNVENLPGDYLPEAFDDDHFYHCRVLIGMQRLSDELLRAHFSEDNDGNTLDNAEALKLKKLLARNLREQLTIGIPNNQDEKALRRLSQQLKSGKVIVKLHLRHPLHAKLYLIYREDYNSPIIGFLGSSNLTLAGVSRQGELNTDVVEQDAAMKLSRWFQDRWEDRWCIDITKELAEIIDTSWASENLIPPYHIYLKIAYHLSREARAGISEFNLTREFKHALLPYQANAVKVAAHHLHKRGGVIIGDVVGLGKTITAAALAKVFEEDFFLETLIISPKNLVVMWEDYVHKYQLRAKVLSVTQAQSKLPRERRYRLVIIDESHNLRNRQGKRYRAVYEYIHLNDSKVILLTATPYNKSYLDLSSQLRLFMNEDENLGIRPERLIESEGGRVQFLANHQVSENSLAAFENSLFSEDWNELMRLFLVRRTRSFIKDNYTKIDEHDGRKYLLFPDGTTSYFPERVPRKVEYNFDPDDPTDQYARLYSETVVDLIDSLNLPRYGLGQDQYQSKKTELIPTDKEVRIQKNLGRAGARLKGFARTNLFKRLESSGYSFLLSVSRHILRNYLFLYAIENDKPFPVGKQEAGLIDAFMYADEDTEEKNNMDLLFSEQEYMHHAEAFHMYLFDRQAQKYDWIRSSLFSRKLKKHLEADSRALLRILNIAKNWNIADDRQLNALYKLCAETHKNDKVLIFTQFSDTAHYLFSALKDRGVDRVACVTGDTENPTAFAHRFSPESNEKFEKIPESQEIRVLITTDVLSEGQNLQDAHIVLNYDLPWAIIRLIQRAGRIDRIGQHSPEILCYSFLPEDGIENIINLRARLRQRIRENAETIGSDETFFDGDPINIRDLYNEKAGIFDDEEDIEIDLASYAYQIWKNATDANPKLKNMIPDLPDVAYAAKKAGKGTRTGAVVYTRTAYDNDMLAWVDEDRNIVTQSQFEILKAVKCEPDVPALPRSENHHKLVEFGVRHIKKVEDSIGGQLGRKTAARYRMYMRLSQYVEKNADPLFVTDSLKKAVEDIYKYPLREYARETLSRQLKTGISDEALINLVITLREDGKLCIISNTETKNKNPQIVCSMGIIEN
ncbi:helicase-related protein [Desulfonema magnum]|uniref:Helicase domain-containing protein n=1 Tax=Desulfonema magnum TaxID=45655 RepID=A0A975BN94_9BACT|nr:helicase-related protein [Desulfonema magnum]QTA88382.1 Helicase domain-containing protein [Desulfonema magnum]